MEITTGRHDKPLASYSFGTVSTVDEQREVISIQLYDDKSGGYRRLDLTKAEARKIAGLLHRLDVSAFNAAMKG